MATEIHDTFDQKADSKNKLPAWRRIEALKERRQLKEALTDIWADDPDFDEGMFAIDGESVSSYYRKGALDDLDADLDDEELDEG